MRVALGFGDIQLPVEPGCRAGTPAAIRMISGGNKRRLRNDYVK
jgi:hypothetical protein